MATHALVRDDRPELVLGSALLPISAVALVVAVVVISLVIALPGTVTLIAAMATVIGSTATIVAILGRLIGSEGALIDEPVRRYLKHAVRADIAGGVQLNGGPDQGRRMAPVQRRGAL